MWGVGKFLGRTRMVCNRPPAPPASGAVNIPWKRRRFCGCPVWPLPARSLAEVKECAAHEGRVVVAFEMMR